MNLRKVSTKASARRAPSSRNSVQSSSRTCWELQRRMWLKKLFLVSFHLKVDLVCLPKWRNIVRLTTWIHSPVHLETVQAILIVLRARASTIAMPISTSMPDNKLLVAGIWWAAATSRNISKLRTQQLQGLADTTRCQSKDWRVQRWTSEFREGSQGRTQLTTKISTMIWTNPMRSNTMATPATWATLACLLSVEPLNTHKAKCQILANRRLQVEREIKLGKINSKYTE